MMTNKTRSFERLTALVSARASSNDEELWLEASFPEPVPVPLELIPDPDSLLEEISPPEELTDPSSGMVELSSSNFCFANKREEEKWEDLVVDILRDRRRHRGAVLSCFLESSK